jgi:hypothetical protein
MRLPNPFSHFPLVSAATASLSACLLLAACNDGEKSIQGAVRISPELQSKISPAAALFIIARPEGVAFGPPLAVKRLPQPFAFPLEFSISDKDAMMPNAQFSGKIMVTARVAQSGAAVPASPGDIEGTAKPNPVEPGKGKIEIVLDHTRD